MKRSRRAVLFVLTLAALAASAATAHAAAWLPGPSLSGTLANYGDVTTDDAGVSTAVWPDDGDGPAQVTAQRIAPDGTAGPLLDLGGGDSASVGATAAGGAVATWWREGATAGESEVVVRTIAADGALGDVRVVAAVPAAGLASDPIGAVAPDGATVAAWLLEDPDDGTLALNARRVAADGTLGPLVDLGLADYDSVRTATTRDGVTHLLWSREREPDSWEYEVVVARLDATGALAGGPQAVSDDPLLAWAELSTGDGGVVATWFEDTAASSTQTLRAVRLPSNEAPGEPVAVDALDASDLSQVTAAVAPDGTATIAWDERTAAGTPIEARQLAADGTLGPVQTVAESPATLRNVFPLLRPLGDGSLLVAWVQATLADGSAEYLTRTLDPDATAAGEPIELPLPARIPGFDPRMLWLSAGPGGDGIAAVVAFDDEDDLSGSFLTARFDGSRPLVEATVPATAVRGEPVVFAATASDPAGVESVAWQFGDGAGASGATATHAYAAAGNHEVTVTATDANGNAATVTKTIAVVEPDPGPGPGGGGGGGEPGPGGGGEPGPGTGGGPGPGGGPVPPAGARAPARLKLTKAVRRGARVTVKGTLDRRASGRVRLVWSQKAGRRTVRRAVRARIARGRFSATIRLPRALARSRAAGRLTVTYAGDADTRRATAKRTVRAAKRRAARPRR